MRFLFIAGALLLNLIYSNTMLAQAPATTNEPVKVAKPSRDFFMFQVGYNNWNNAPDSVNIKGLNRTINVYLSYDWPIGKSNFSFAAGLGVSASNTFFDNQEMVFTDTGGAAQVRFIPEEKDYKRYKLTTAYIEAPFELRYFGNKINRNRGFKAAIGFKAGMIVGAHTKGVYGLGGSNITDKTGTRRYFETWRFSGQVRVGWGNLSLFGTYSLNSLFKTGSGPEVFPYSIGLCLTGL